MKSIKRSLEKFDRDIKDLAQESNKTTLTKVHVILCFWAFRDGIEDRVHKTMPFQEKLQLINEIISDLV